jgi:hypothetical protein
MFALVSRPIEARDFTDGAACTLWRILLQRGMTTAPDLPTLLEQLAPLTPNGAAASSTSATS